MSRKTLPVPMSLATAMSLADKGYFMDAAAMGPAGDDVPVTKSDIMRAIALALGIPVIDIMASVAPSMAVNHG